MIEIFHCTKIRVTIEHSESSDSAQQKFVSHLEIRHMVYTDTGAFPVLNYTCSVCLNDYFSAWLSFPRVALVCCRLVRVQLQ